MQFSKNNLLYYKLRITSSASSLISLIYISIIHSFVPCFLVLLASSEHITFYKRICGGSKWTRTIDLTLIRRAL